MMAPTQRILVYPIKRTPGEPSRAEVIILGDPKAIADMFVRVLSALSAWPGFGIATWIGMGTTIGCQVQINPVRASHVDAVAEVIDCLRMERLGISWSGGAADDRRGVLGEW